MWFDFSDGREILGMGTVFWKDDEPAAHLHGAIGRCDEARVSRVRTDGIVYLAVEAWIAGIDARQTVDSRSGLALLDHP